MSMRRNIASAAWVLAFAASAAFAQEDVARTAEEEARWLDAAQAWRVAAEEGGGAAAREGEARALLRFAEEVFASGEIGGAVKAAYEDARAAYRKAAAEGGTSLGVLLGLAQCADALEERDEQVRVLREAVAAFPTEKAPRRALAFALYHAQQSEEAFALFRSLSDADPGDLNLALTLAEAARTAGDEPLAVAAANRAIESATEDARGWRALWAVYAPKQRWGELADALVALAKRHETSAYAAHYAGMAAGSARRWDDALSWLQRAWELQPLDHPARLEAARILYTHKKDKAGAAAHYAAVLEADPQQRAAADGLFFLAQRTSEEGDPAGAVPLFAAVARAREGDGAAQANLALALRWAGRYEESETAYRRAIQLEPADPQIRNDFGLLLLVLGRGEDARAEFLAGHDADPLHNDCPENLGFVARAAGRRDEALQWFQVAWRASVRRGEDGARHRVTVDDQRWPLPPVGAR